MFKLYKGAWISDDAPHLSKKISSKECVELFHKGGYLVRNTYNFDINSEKSFWYVIKDSFGEMTELSSKMRNQVKKSLKTYDVRIVSANEIMSFGLAIYNSALENYRVKANTLTQKQFEEMIKEQSKDSRIEYWGVFEKSSGKPVALAINTVREDCCEYNSMKCDPVYQHNSTYPYYGLIYEMNRYYLQERCFKYVNDGTRSITEHSNIQPFLIEKFNFRKAYCNLQIEYKWYLKLFVNFLYPFREKINIKKIKSILRMEAIRRNEY